MYLSSWQMKYKERVLGLILVSPVCKAPSWTEWLYNKVWSRSLSQLNLWESENSMEPTMDANQKICNQLNVGTDRCLVSKRILIWQPVKTERQCTIWVLHGYEIDTLKGQRMSLLCRVLVSLHGIEVNGCIYYLVWTLFISEHYFLFELRG